MANLTSSCLSKCLQKCLYYIKLLVFLTDLWEPIFTPRWRPTSGRLPIGTGKAEEMKQQVKYDPEIGVIVFDQEIYMVSDRPIY